MESDTFPPVQPPTILPIPGYTPLHPVQPTHTTAPAAAASVPERPLADIQHSDISNGPLEDGSPPPEPVVSYNGDAAGDPSLGPASQTVPVIPTDSSKVHRLARGDIAEEATTAAAAPSSSACDNNNSSDKSVATPPTEEEQPVVQPPPCPTLEEGGPPERRSSSPVVILLGESFITIKIVREVPVWYFLLLLLRIIVGAFYIFCYA